MKPVVLPGGSGISLTRGWLTRLTEHLERDPKVEMVGSVTNFAENLQKIRARYRTLQEPEAFAARRAQKYRGRFFEVDMLGMFSVVMRRKLIDEVGLLDERFGLGNFEDDDYSLRVRLAGYKLICAEDVFIHHCGKGTMSELGEREYLNLFEHNKCLFEKNGVLGGSATVGDHCLYESSFCSRPRRPGW